MLGVTVARPTGPTRVISLSGTLSAWSHALLARPGTRAGLVVVNLSIVACVGAQCARCADYCRPPRRGLDRKRTMISRTAVRRRPSFCYRTVMKKARLRIRLCARRSTPRAKFIPKFSLVGEQSLCRPAMAPILSKNKRDVKCSTN